MPPQRRQRATWVGAAIVIVMAAAAAGLVVADSTGSRARDHPGGLPSETHPATSPVTAVDPSLVDRQPPAGRESSLLPVSSTTPGGKPVSPTVVIPALGIHAAILPEGIDQTPGDKGNLAVPSDVAQVGWWDGGPAPGQAGVAVLAAHRAQGGAFWTLPSIATGDSVIVTGTNGQTTTWNVDHVQQLLKADLPSSIWTEGGTPRLALVTCGGVFNYRIGHYDDNVIVWATPA